MKMVGAAVLSTGDSCNDVIVDNQGATLDEFAFQENLKIPARVMMVRTYVMCGYAYTLKYTHIMIFYKLCIGDTTSVVLQTCFSWRTNGQDVDCDESGAYPGGPSKCDDLGITIIGPSEAPSISTQPTQQPSQNPSTSTQPTTIPSYQPSVSSKPSDHPSFSPSISSAPSSPFSVQ